MIIKLKDLLVENGLTVSKSTFQPKNTNIVFGSLKNLGIDPLKIRNSLQKKSPHSKAQGLWSYEPNVLWELLELARDNYKSMMKKYHPDVSKEDANKAALLNSSWEIVRRLFAEHGYELEK